MTEATSIKMSDSYKKDSHIQQTATGHAIATEVLPKRLLQYISDNQEEFDSPKPFRIAEFGCADGSNSLSVLTQLISTIRAKSSSKPIEIICTDLPTANFSILFDTLNPLKEKFGNVYIQASGESFYSQILADNSVDMAFSFTSIHWISQVPCFLEGTMYTPLSEGAFSEDAASAWRHQAEQDWRLFLDCRSKELKSNGLLYVTTVCYPTPTTKANLAQARMNVEAMGILVEVLQEYGIEEHKKEFNLPMVSRQRKDFMEPFEGEKPLEGVVNEFYNDFSFKVDIFKKMIESGDKEALRNMMKSISRAATGPYYKSKLEKIEGLTDEKRTEIWEKIYDSILVGTEKFYGDIQDDDYGRADYCEMMIRKLQYAC